MNLGQILQRNFEHDVSFNSVISITTAPFPQTMNRNSSAVQFLSVWHHVCNVSFHHYWEDVSMKPWGTLTHKWPTELCQIKGKSWTLNPYSALRGKSTIGVNKSCSKWSSVSWNENHECSSPERIQAVFGCNLFPYMCLTKWNAITLIN